MKILVVCGAGASSTFVALRIRRAARAQATTDTATAVTVDALADHLTDADVVLVGSHMHAALTRVRTAAAATGTPVALLSPEAASDPDGSRALALAHQTQSAQTQSAQTQSAQTQSAQTRAAQGPDHTPPPTGTRDRSTR